MRTRKRKWEDEVREQVKEATADIEQVLERMDGKLLTGATITIEINPDEYVKVHYNIDSFAELRLGR